MLDYILGFVCGFVPTVVVVCFLVFAELVERD